MIIRLYVECMCDYDFVVNVNSSLELYNLLIINELINESEDNLISCAYWFNLLTNEETYVEIKGINNFNIHRIYSSHLEKLYEK